MPASGIAGKGGAVKINGTPVTTVALVDNWTGDLNADLYDQTSLGDDWKSDVPGLKSLTGSISGKWDVTGDAGQTTLHNAILQGITVGLNILTNGTDGYEFTARLSKFTTTDPVAGLVTFQASFQSQGQVFFS